MSNSATQTNIHLRGDDQRISAAATEGIGWSGLTIEAGPVMVQIFFHQENNTDNEPNGFTDESIMRSIDELMEELVKLRTRAMRRIRERQIDAEDRAKLEAEKLPVPFDPPGGRVLTQDECDILGLDNREKVWRYDDLDTGQQATIRAAGVHSLIQR